MSIIEFFDEVMSSPSVAIVVLTWISALLLERAEIAKSGIWQTIALILFFIGCIAWGFLMRKFITVWFERWQ